MTAGGRLKAHISSQRSQLGLDWLNFFQADVQTAFGPFVSLYLALNRWPQHEIGIALSVSVVAALVLQIPGGALVDAVSMKRLLIGGAIAMMAASSLLIALWPDFAVVAAAQVLLGASTSIIRPALAGLALGIVGHGGLSGRLGRNQIYNSLGTALTAGVMGALGNYLSASAPFYVAAALCVPAGLALATIRGRDIDYAQARSSADRANPRKVHRVHHAMRNRALGVFILGIFLFQLANAGLVPMVTARLGYAGGGSSPLITSALVLVPQLVTVLIAIWIARRADRLGRKPLLVVGLATVAVRAALFPLASGPWTLIPIQLIDGFSAAIIGVMMPLVIADLTRGTGRYNFVQGVAGTAIAGGAALSTTLTGYEAEAVGYDWSFISLGAIAVLGVATLWLFLPETKPQDGKKEG